jgi:hypothetical protein
LSAVASRVDVPVARPDKRLGVAGRLRYWRRVLSAYVGGGQSHLTFWHGTVELNEQADPRTLGQYWQFFPEKADYPGQHDADGIPMLDYHGHVGLQHNPIAIAQWGLGNHDLWLRTREPERRARFLRAGEWLLANLEPDAAGQHVWPHRFRWEYQTLLPYGWYSALAQGQGLSLLLRAHRETSDPRYLEAAEHVLDTFFHEMEEGGVVHTDRTGDLWLEEVIVTPPTHILNGMMWASWGLYDHWLHTGSERARARWQDSVRTLLRRLGDFDLGYWSKYDIAGARLENPASAFYHALHVVQLRVMARLSGDAAFERWADRWDGYQKSGWRRRLAWGHKATFKLLYY